MRASELEEARIIKEQMEMLKSNPTPKSKIQRVYVAGAYSSNNVLGVFANMRKGMNLALEVLQHGYAPFVPWFDYHFSLLSENVTLEMYYAYSMAWLEKSDAVILVPGWENSNGTQKEIERAKELGIPVVNGLDALEALG